MKAFSSAERQVVTKIAQGVEPHRGRALALLALDQGVTQAEASELSGLSRTRVSYWQDRFQREALSIFPKNLVSGYGTLGTAKASSRKTPEPEAAESAQAASRGGKEEKPNKETLAADEPGKGKKPTQLTETRSRCKERSPKRNQKARGKKRRKRRRNARNAPAAKPTRQEGRRARARRHVKINVLNRNRARS
jgi:hypothetical protein